MAGMAIGGFSPNVRPPQQNSYFGMAYNPSTTSNLYTSNLRQNNAGYSPQSMYNSSLPQTTADYDRIMQGYNDILGRSQSSSPNTGNLRNSLNAELNRGPITGERVTYTPTGDVTNALGTLRGYSQNGGYTDEDIRSLRERGISPIRSVYANARRNLDRQRTLQGGYSPGYAAATTRMAREMSGQIADRVTDVNASIANNQAAGRRDMAGAYGNLASSESGRYLSTATGNADRQLEAARTNAMSRSSILNNLAQLEQLDRMPNQDALRALEGMRSLYGTTPALPQLFGSQAMAATQNAQNQQQQAFNNRATSQNMIRNAYNQQFANRPAMGIRL